MRLRPYIADTDFEYIREWDSDERIHALWCAGRMTFPVSINNVIYSLFAIDAWDSGFHWSD